MTRIFTYVNAYKYSSEILYHIVLLFVNIFFVSYFILYVSENYYLNFFLNHFTPPNYFSIINSK